LIFTVSVLIEGALSIYLPSIVSIIIVKRKGSSVTSDRKQIEDKLNRRDFCERLAKFIEENGTKEDGLTITLNGGYGSGKTIFLDLLEKKLSSEGKMTVVYHDCWKNSVIEEPLLSIIYSISEEMGVWKESLKKKGLKVAKQAGKFLLHKIVGEIPEADKDETALFDEIEEYNKLVGTFKEELGKIATEKNIVILFDEIDRCLPAYAIQILEKIKHIFDITGITCLIAVDNSQLEKTIETIFGQNTNVRGYLARFVDYDFDLPKAVEFENNLLMSKLKGRKSAKDMISILDCYGFELREKLKLFDMFTLYDSWLEPYVEDIMLAILKSIKLKDDKLFKEMEKASLVGPVSPTKFEDMMTVKLTKHLEEKRFFQKVPSLSPAMVKMMFLLAFREADRIERRALEAYMGDDHQRYLTTISDPSYTKMMKRVLKFINELS